MDVMDVFQCFTSDHPPAMGSHGSPGSQVPADHRPAGGAADDLSKRAQSGQVPGNMVKIMDTGDLPSGDLPSGDLPSGDLPSGDLPSGDLPSGDLPSGDLPSGDLPSGDLPSGDLPSGDLATWFAMENLPSGDLTISMANLVHYPWRIHGAARKMVTWIPSIYPQMLAYPPAVPCTLWWWLTVCHGKIHPFLSSVNHLFLWAIFHGYVK